MDEQAMGEQAIDESVLGERGQLPDAATPAQRHPHRYGVLGAVIAGFFALFFAYSVWESLNSLLAFSGLFEALGLAMPPSMWIVLLANVALSPLAFLLALWIGWRQPNWARALVFLTGLAVCQALTLGLTTLLTDSSLL